MICRCSQRKIIRCIGLHDNISFLIASACPSCNLSYQLKGSLCRAIIRNVQTDIGSNDADQPYVLKVKTFGNQLGADENIRLTLRKIPYNTVYFSAIFGSVKIQSFYRSVRKEFLCKLLHLFGA